MADTVGMTEIGLMCDAHERFSLRLPMGHFTLRAHAGCGSGDAEVEGMPAGDES